MFANQVFILVWPLHHSSLCLSLIFPNHINQAYSLARSGLIMICINVQSIRSTFFCDDLYHRDFSPKRMHSQHYNVCCEREILQNYLEDFSLKRTEISPHYIIRFEMKILQKAISVNLFIQQENIQLQSFSLA